MVNFLGISGKKEEQSSLELSEEQNRSWDFLGKSFAQCLSKIFGMGNG